MNSTPSRSSKWARWSWEGVFSVAVPPGWTVNQSEGLIEIVPPEPLGAAQISVLRRTKSGAVKPGEAAGLLENFADRLKAGLTHCREERLGGEGLRASGAVCTTDEQGELAWLLESRVWGPYALICSFNYEPHRGARVCGLAQRMFESLTADIPDREATEPN